MPGALGEALQLQLEPVEPVLDAEGADEGEESAYQCGQNRQDDPQKHNYHGSPFLRTRNCRSGLRRLSVRSGRRAGILCEFSI